MQSPIEVLEEKLGHQFRDRRLLIRALTHRSWLAERSSVLPEEGDNEQLEFLGDSILGFVVSQALVLRYPLQREGKLSQWKAHLVSAKYLYERARAIGIGEFLQLGKGEEQNGGRERPTLLANALEAVIAALHLDGGLMVAQRLIEAHILMDVENLKDVGSAEMLNYKSLLQEQAQALGFPPPRYITIGTSGPEHAKLFTIEARIGDKFSGRAIASSKKGASQEAAGNLWKAMSLSRAGAHASTPAETEKQ